MSENDTKEICEICGGADLEHYILHRIYENKTSGKKMTQFKAESVIYTDDGDLANRTKEQGLGNSITFSATQNDDGIMVVEVETAGKIVLRVKPGALRIERVK